jgi:chemosensory pili system protein ChpA (sensor histidine kinase/response regulator)
MADAEPVFEELNTHLGQLVKKAENAAVVASEAPKLATATVQPSGKTTKVLSATFKRDVLVALREMLQLFKQQDSPEHREALQEQCVCLANLGEECDLPGWGELLETARSAIAFTPNSYRQLASLVIKEIKQAQELAVAGRSVEIAPSEQLKALAPSVSTAESFIASDTDVQTESRDFQMAQGQDNATLNSALASNAFNSKDTYIQDTDTYIQEPDTYIQEDIREELNKQDFTQSRMENGEFLSWQAESDAVPSSISNRQSRSRAATGQPTGPSEPEVGMAELNSLADIFEGQTPDLDQTWQEEEIITLDDEQSVPDLDSSLSLDDQNEFSDLIDEMESLEVAADGATTGDDWMGWLSDDFQEEATLGSQELTDSLSSDRNSATLPSPTDSATFAASAQSRAGASVSI